jgi:lysyl-tRNA synthetase class 1
MISKGSLFIYDSQSRESMSLDGKENTSGQFPAHWLEGFLNEIMQRNPSSINLSTGKTPSGHIHLGILRELLICDALRRLLESKGFKVNYRLFFDSLDAAKRFPSYISTEYAQENLGKPFALIGDPSLKGKKSYAEVFGEELTSTFQELGIQVEIQWSHNLYKTPEMQEMIRIGLEKNEVVKDTVAKYLTATMTDEQKQKYLKEQKSWMGAMIICERCQRTQKKEKDGTVTPNRAIFYDKEKDEVGYHCPACNLQSSVKISSGLVKLNWRLDWPAKWTLFKTTCEPAGKDHCTPGGSYDTGLDLCKSIYDYEGPVKVAYEWLRLGDNDMKTSKGIVFTPSHFLELADPEIIRMIIYQTNPNKHISIRIEELEQYYNELDRIEKIYFGIEKPTNLDEGHEIKYIFPLIYPYEMPKFYQKKIPFKMYLILSQLQSVLGEKGIYDKAVSYMEKEGFQTIISQEKFQKQIERARNWINEIKIMIQTEKNLEEKKKLEQKVILFSIPTHILPEIKNQLDDNIKSALNYFLEAIQKIEALSEEEIKRVMMDIQANLNLKPNKIFHGFYLVFLGEKTGPRLGPLLNMLDKDWIENRIKEALNP